MVTIRQLKRKEQYEDPNKIVVVSTDGTYSNEKHYCQMCKLIAADSLLKYNEETKIWQCWRCGYEIDESLNQTPKREDKPTIGNEPKIMKPYAISLRNFSVTANSTLEQEESSIRSFQRPRYSSAREAWLADDDYCNT